VLWRDGWEHMSGATDSRQAERQSLEHRTPNGTRPLTDDDMRVRFPEHDFDGYWLMGGIRGSGEFEALLLGFSIGVNDGYDWGFIDVKPDPDFCLYTFRFVGRERSVGYGEQPIHRHEFDYDRRRLDVRRGPRFHVEGSWPNITYHMESADGEMTVDLRGRMGGIAHWSRDMVLRGTSWVTVAMPDLEYEGLLKVGADEFAFTGVGTLDHPMGRIFQSPVSAGMGWWEYNCFMLNEKFGLYQWKIVDGTGEVLSSEVVTNFPDGKYHVGALDLEYEAFEDRQTIHVPRAWRSVVHADHGVFEYRVEALGEKWDGAPHGVGAPLPNFLLSLDGVFTPNGGAPPEQLTGKGTGETVVSEWNPHTNSSQRPW